MFQQRFGQFSATSHVETLFWALPQHPLAQVTYSRGTLRNNNSFSSSGDASRRLFLLAYYPRWLVQYFSFTRAGGNIQASDVKKGTRQKPRWVHHRLWEFFRINNGNTVKQLCSPDALFKHYKRWLRCLFVRVACLAHPEINITYSRAAPYSSLPTPHPLLKIHHFEEI